MNECVWVYGDECDFLWKHFGFIMTDRDPKDRIKVKLISYETSEEQEADKFQRVLYRGEKNES